MAARRGPSRSVLRDRGFRLDDEVRLDLLEVGFAAPRTTVFERDRRDANGFPCATWQARPFREWVAETPVLPLRSQLEGRPPTR